MNNLYSIKINKTGRYVKYCDNCWYETISEPVNLWTKEEADAVAKQLRQHYVYDVTISNGTDTYRRPLKEMAPAKKTMSLKNFKVTLKAKK